MNKFHQGFDEILYWLKKKGPDFVLESFFHPRPDIFQETDLSLEIIAEILTLLQEDKKLLFADLCLSCLNR